MSSYKDLIVWQKSIDLAEAIYRLTKKLPDEEKYNLVSQMRRSAVSISSNIAEGQGRKTNKELAHFLRIAFGSASELETQVILCERFKFIVEQETSEMRTQITEIYKMLNKLIASLATND